MREEGSRLTSSPSIPAQAPAGLALFRFFRVRVQRVMHIQLLGLLLLEVLRTL